MAKDLVERLISGPVPVIHGPTASGKTALAHALCEGVLSQGRPVAIINADAFQFYRGFSAGTAKPTLEERERYAYAFVDTHSPEETPDAQVFGQQARDFLSDRRRAGVFVVIVGGSGLYGRSLLHGLDELPARHDALRDFFREVARVQGRAVLHSWLGRLDAQRAAKIHPSDLVRTERALEIYFATGQVPSSLETLPGVPREHERLFEARVINLRFEPEGLARRIAKRTEVLMRGGVELLADREGPWVAEVRDLLEIFSDRFEELPAARAIGYRDIAARCRRENPLSSQTRLELEALITTRTVQYAKRQRTWLGTAAGDVQLESETAVLDYLESCLSR